MNKESPPGQLKTQWKKCRIRLMRSAIIKEASQDEQQNQTTANTNYIQ